MSPETESETPGNETPESECCRVLGEERFADVQCQVNPLPPEVDRGAVYRAVTDGKYTHMAYASLSSELVRKRDKAVAALRSDLNQLKRALEGSPWPPAIADLERAFRKATETEVLDDGSRRVPPLLFSREERRWIEPSLTGGRPRIIWRKRTEAALRELNVPALAIKDILDAAGLTAARRTWAAPPHHPQARKP